MYLTTLLVLAVLFCIALVFKFVPFGMEVTVTDPPPPAPPAALTVTDEQLTRIVDTVVKKSLEANKTPPPAIAPDQKPKASMRFAVKPWQKRAAAYLHALAVEADGRKDESRRLIDALSVETRSLPDVQREDELQEAFDIIERSNLSLDVKVRTMSTLTAGAGGELLPKPFLAEVFRWVETYGEARRLFRTIPMISKDLDLKTLATDVTVYWTAENAKFTETGITYGNGKLTTYKLTAMLSWTTELTEDEAIAQMPIIMERVGMAIAKAEDEAGFIGDGTTAYGNFTGLLNAATTLLTLDAGKVDFENATADDYRRAINKVTKALRKGARWFMSSDVIMNCELMKDKNGQYIFKGPAVAGGIPQLWGYPVEEIAVMPDNTDTAVSTRFAAFGRPEFMLMGLRAGLTAQVSTEGVITDGTGHVTYNALEQDGNIITLRERVAFKAPLGEVFVAMRTAAA